MDNTNYGSRSHEIRVAEVMAKKGNEVILCVERMPDFEDDPVPDNLRIIPMPLSKGLRRPGKGLLGGIVEGLGRKKVFRDLIAGLKNEGKIDVIFNSCINGVDVTAETGRELGIPVVTQVLDIPTWQLDPPGFRNPHYRLWKYWMKYLALSDRIVVNNEITRKDLIDFADKLKLKFQRDIPIVPYGISTDIFDKIPEQEELDQFIFISRLVPYKGADLLIEATSRVKNPPALVIIGEGHERAGLEKLAKEKNVKCEFRGAISDPDKITEIKRSKFMVFTSTTEHIAGLSPLEAMYCKKPCICFDIKILRELYEDSVEYVPKGDVDALAKKIELFSSDENYRKKRGDEGKEFVKRKLSSDRHAEELLKIMESTLKM